MTTFDDVKRLFINQEFKMIIAADAETRLHVRKGQEIVSKIPAGGVAVAMDPVARASNACFIARGKTEEDKKVVDFNGKIKIGNQDGEYILKRLFFPEDEFEKYYNGFSNQALWPLCHVAFQRPSFNKEWYQGFRRVNEKFAQAIKEEIKGKTLIWVNDYQLSLVPLFLQKPKDTYIGLFWHIPWPTWEVFRILPFKAEILKSLLMCDFVAFHRGYHVRNFMRTVEREFEARTDQETNKVYFANGITTVENLPMGIDVDVVKSLLEKERGESFLLRAIKKLLNIEGEKKQKAKSKFDVFFEDSKVILGVDRLDYTKGLILRLMAIDKFLNENPEYIGNIVYVGIISPSREKIPSYSALKKDIKNLSQEINSKYSLRNEWKPIHLIFETFQRDELLNFYKKADLCLVTPLDDGMNLVSKEYIIASSFSLNPGMLVLSQFAGSAIDLTSALIVNPYDIDQVAKAIKDGLKMSKKEKKERITSMVDILEEKNVYQWAIDFIRNTQNAAKENRK